MATGMFSSKVAGFCLINVWNSMKVEDGRLVAAEWLSSPNFDQRPNGPDGDISLLVIHNISLPPGQYGGGYIQRFFQNRLSADEHEYFKDIADLRVSSHLLIERTGHVVQFVNTDQRAWHAGVSEFAGRSECNDFSIGIELEGCDDQAYSEKQYQVLADVTQALMRAYPHISRERIVGHVDIAPERKTDPGPAFDWQRYLGMLHTSD